MGSTERSLKMALKICDHEWRSQIPRGSRKLPRYVVDRTIPKTSATTPIKQAIKLSTRKNRVLFWLCTAIKFFCRIIYVPTIVLVGVLLELPDFLASALFDNNFSRRGKINPTTNLVMINDAFDSGGNLYLSFSDDNFVSSSEDIFLMPDLFV